MPLSCPHCAAQMPETAAFCPGCGLAMQEQPRARGKAGGLAENIVGALAYLTFVPAVVFLLREPYKKNRFVRFHSVQSLLLWLAGIAAAAALRLAGIAFPLFVVLAAGLLLLAALLIWLVLVVKALQGEMFKLPLLGNLAALHSGENTEPEHHPEGS